VAKGWLIIEVGYFEVSLSNHQSDEYFCPSTLQPGATVYHYHHSGANLTLE